MAALLLHTDGSPYTLQWAALSSLKQPLPKRDQDPI